METRTIRVQGHANVSKRPDIIVLSFAVVEKELVYQDCIRNANQRVEILQLELEKLHIDKKSLKTTNYSISTDYVYDDKKKERVFTGYKVNHSLQLELPFDKEQTGRIIDMLSLSKSRAEMNISFDLKDKQALQKELLETAVELAKRNAEIIASSAGITLGPIRSIEYGWSEIRIENHLRLDAMELRSSLADIEPEDLTAQDSVTITWDIL